MLLLLPCPTHPTLTGSKMGESSCPLRTSGERLTQSKALPVLKISHQDILICASMVRLDELHMFGNIQEYLSPDPFAYCQSRRNRPPCHDLSIIEKLHELFRDIYEVADEARAQNEDDVALSILFALVWALKLYPQLLETRKRHMLLKIARLFQEMGRRWDCEQVLLIIASKCKLSPLPSSEDPYHLLTTSMPASSMSIRHVLGNRFKETLSGNLVDLNLSMPPLHCAVQHQNPSIIIALLSNNNNCSSLQSAPAPTAPSNNAQMTVNIEDRDLHCWTALFAAVINGDADCCYTLLIHGADANTRDEYGHTALEVAVRRGNYDIVKILIENGAQVNPNILCCSSLPLHAAVENGNFQPEIIEYLINCDAKVDPRRSVDWKRATDFAYNQGHHMLAERMHRMIPNQHQAHFMHRDTSMDEIPRPQTNGTSTSTYN